ncbi:MAG: hypothetical protein JNG84_09745 [Archangium sp.]|nr:hypothetical protein [Archangium sp.]
MLSSFALAVVLTLADDAGVLDAGTTAPPAPPQAPAVAPTIFNGVWELDLKASSDIKPLMDLLDVGGITRLLAPGVVTTQTITATAEKLELKVSSTFKNRASTWKFDGTTAALDEVFDNKLEVTSRFVDGAVVSTGTLHIEGGTIPVTMRRFIDGARMVQETTFSPKGRDPLVVRRVFNRKK